MARKPLPELHDPAIAAEARHLAEDALEEMQHGNKDEAKFVIDEARQLDREAVDGVLKKQDADRKDPCQPD